MSTFGYGSGHKVFQHQPDINLVQANPVDSTYYVVLTPTKDVRLISIQAQVAGIGIGDLYIEITVDGNVLPCQFPAPADTTEYYVVPKLGSAVYGISATEPVTLAFLLEGRTVGVRVKYVGGAPTVLQCRVKWAKIP